MRKQMMARVLLVVSVIGSMFGIASADSKACNGGDVHPANTPAGIGVARTGDVAAMSGSATICNNGMLIPKPAKGSVTVGGDLSDQYGFVEADGDSDNTPPDCADGYTRVEMRPSGPTFYESPSGGHSGSAKPDAPADFVANTIENCQ